jgi:hypothetical protein
MLDWQILVIIAAAAVAFGLYTLLCERVSR